MILWNFQVGCTKASTGCLHCYAEASYKRYGKDFTTVRKTRQFHSIRSKIKYPVGEEIWVCNSSDFFHEDADMWRADAWDLIKSRPDLRFLIVTKRIKRIIQSLPSNWQDGYDNVWLCCTAEDQENADYRLPIFDKLPAKHKMIMVEPLFSKVDLSKHLATGKYVQVVSGGECSNNRTCRVTRRSDVEFLRDQCKCYNVGFVFERTGTKWAEDVETNPDQYTYIRGQGAQVNIAETLGLNYDSGNPDCLSLPMKFSR